MPHYLYGLVPAGSTAPSTAGIGGAEVTTWSLGHGLAALRSEVSDLEVEPRRAPLRAHHQVLAEAMASYAVLPLHFGTVTDEDPSVLLRGLEAEEVHHRLRQLEGHVEVQVLWDPDEESALERVVHRRPELRDRSVDAMERGRSTMRTLSDLAAEDLTAIVANLGDLAVTTAPVEQIGTSARVAALVPAEQFDAFEARCDRFAQRTAAVGNLRTVGALPPYSFAELHGEPAEG